MVGPDGTISLMEISSKKVIWSFKSGPPIYSSYQALPNREGDKHGGSSLSGSFFMDLGQDDWELYMHVNDSTIVVYKNAIFLHVHMHKLSLYELVDLLCNKYCNYFFFSRNLDSVLKN